MSTDKPADKEQLEAPAQDMNQPEGDERPERELIGEVELIWMPSRQNQRQNS